MCIVIPSTSLNRKGLCSVNCCRYNAEADPDIPFRGGGHEMRLTAKRTIRSFVGQKLIYNEIITRKI